MNIRLDFTLGSSWPWGIQIEPVHVPEGDWKIVFFVIHRYRQMVGKPAPNAEGFVLDHCSSLFVVKSR